MVCYLYIYFLLPANKPSGSQFKGRKPVTLCFQRKPSGCDTGGRWRPAHQDCRMSRPPSGGPPLPASCCRLFHWISSSSRMMVCCFLNSCSVFWCFSAKSCAQTGKRRHDSGERASTRFPFSGHTFPPHQSVLL